MCNHVGRLGRSVHMNSIFWFEIPAKDRKRVTDFYAKAFGWKIQMLGPEVGDYAIAQTGPTDKDGMPEKPNFVNGGFFKRTDDPNTQTPNLVMATSDIQKTIKDITAAGGTVLGEPMEIPGYGTYVCFLDPEGTRSAVMQPKM